jgi:proteasome accessory factor C
MGDLRHMEKLFTLYRILTSYRHTVSKETLCRELQCDRSTFFRLKNTVSSLFEVEIFYDSKTRGYKIEDGKGNNHPIPGLWFKDEEIEALMCFEYIAESLQEGFIGEVFRPFRLKIESMIKMQGIKTQNWKNRIKIVKIAARRIPPNIFKVVAFSVLHRKKIRIIYNSINGVKKSDRIVSPQTLLCYRDNWYLDAMCHLKNELRTFALNRIAIAEPKKEKAVTVAQGDLHNHFANSYGIFSGPGQNVAKILFKNIAAQIVEQEEWHPRQKGCKNVDGSYLLELPYSKKDELIMDILKWGGNAEVLEPEELRGEIISIIKNMNKNYSSRTI